MGGSVRIHDRDTAEVATVGVSCQKNFAAPIVGARMVGPRSNADSAVESQPPDRWPVTDR